MTQSSKIVGVLIVAMGGALAWQAMRIGTLSERLDALESAPEATATIATVDAIEAPSVAAIPQLQARVQRLETVVAPASDRPSPRVESRSAPLPHPQAPPKADEAQADEIAALRADVDHVLTKPAEPPIDDDKIKELAATAADEARDQRRARWRQIREEGDAQFIKDLGTKADLSDDQATELATIQKDRRELRGRLMGELRAGDRTMGDVQKEMEASQEAATEQIRLLLSVAQYEAYVAAEEERRERSRRLWH